MINTAALVNDPPSATDQASGDVLVTDTVTLLLLCTYLRTELSPS
jgi:hypothetical protein